MIVTVGSIIESNMHANLNINKIQCSNIFNIRILPINYSSRNTFVFKV